MRGRAAFIQIGRSFCSNLSLGPSQVEELVWGAAYPAAYCNSVSRWGLKKRTSFALGSLALCLGGSRGQEGGEGRNDQH